MQNTNKTLINERNECIKAIRSNIYSLLRNQLKYVKILEKMDKAQDIIEVCDKMINQYYEDITHSYELGIEFFTLKAYNEIILERYNDALETCQNATKALGKHYPMNWEIKVCKATVFEKMFEFEKAIKILEDVCSDYYFRKNELEEYYESNNYESYKFFDECTDFDISQVENKINLLKNKTTK